ncbi:Rne/Rng family ribonuclease [Salinibacterium sp. ZJ70]|uniref:Rne/Rng family ribonuclease n=1 Tax=Salinibacterium sp. ZJ70 TaxID=2708084 RepID=UPI00141D9CEA|nr:Rne/Rng family ribonuclease [Salinibacterium sp. ZJ70]
MVKNDESHDDRSSADSADGAGAQPPRRQPMLKLPKRGRLRKKAVAEQPEVLESAAAEQPVEAPDAEPDETPAETAQVSEHAETTAEQASETSDADTSDSDTSDSEEAAPATSTPSSPFALIFQAPPPPPPGVGVPVIPSDADAEAAGSPRRRNRRRAGEAPREGDDAPNVVTKVRQPRKQPEPITEPQKVKGSTRLEAKKQRRRDGRDAGRRRPVITEAEFLARRESVDRVMVVRSKFGRIQIGVLEDGVLVEHYVARAADASLIGNVYLGRVQNVLPSMEAAFVDIGRGRNAVLYSGEVDWEAAAANAEGDAKNQPRRIELALKPGDRVLVQVTKDPVGHKGARLTSQISLPGRYLVYVPGGSMNGISRKLPDTERARLKKILKEVLPDDAGVIVRTAAEGATEEQLTLDVQRLTAQWAEIERAVETQQAPAMLHSEPDLLVKIIRDVFNEDFQKLVIAGDDAQATIERYLAAVAPDLLDRVERYEGDVDSFDRYRISEQIEKALERKVWLPSGGSLVIDRTEAMTVVDVNTGKFVGSGGNLEETVTKNNLEAAEEIVRQLRLRDIGGIIVVDFIDMVLESNRDLVLRRLVECLSRDRTKHQVAEVTSLGLVQMTRKKLGLGLLESFSENCEHCAGRGIIVHHDPVFKHRGQQQEQQSSSARGRRGRGGNGEGGNGGKGGNGNGGGGNAAQTPAKPSVTGTHEITDDVKNALAKIASSTVHHEVSTDDVADVLVGGVPEASAPESTEAPSAEVGAEQVVEILDIPIAPVREKKRPVADAEAVLGSVLDALPEPAAPGKGRSRRSRRASSAAGAPTTATEQPSE